MDNIRSIQPIRGQNEQKLYNELNGAIWIISSRLNGDIASGTGFCISADGLIMTCAHCVPGKNCSVARQGDKHSQKALVLHKIESWDIAILCLEGNLTEIKEYPFVSFAKDGTLNPGEDVYAISHQWGLMYSFCSGKISYPCKNTVKPFGQQSSESSGKVAAVPFSQQCADSSKKVKEVPFITSQYRTHKEVSSHQNLNEDLPMIEIRNIHIGDGGSGGPIFLPTREVVGILTSGSLSKNYAVHVSALQIAFVEAKKKYKLLLEKLAAKNDEQLQQKSSAISAIEKSEMEPPPM